MSERILIIKTSSMGDILHALPALSDAEKQYPRAHFDWLVDESFADIVRLHPAVDTVYSLGIRKWRHQNPFSTLKQIYDWRGSLPKKPYDLIIDGQGLWKSALIGRSIKGTLAGFDKLGARERTATWLYHRKIYADRHQHAVHQIRDLFAKTLGYAHPHGQPDYGIRNTVKALPAEVTLEPRSILCFHGTTWSNKHLPEQTWLAILSELNNRGLKPVLAYGNDEELQRARRLAQSANARILDKMSLMQLGRVLCDATGTIGLDTGLSHLAAALEVPSIALFGPTKPTLSGPIGTFQQTTIAEYHCAPCGKRRCHQSPSAPYAPCWQSIKAGKVVLSLSEQIDLKSNA